MESLQVINKKQDLSILLENAKIFQNQSNGVSELLISLVIRDIEICLNSLEVIPSWVLNKFELLLCKFYTFNK